MQSDSLANAVNSVSSLALSVSTAEEQLIRAKQATVVSEERKDNSDT